MLCALKFPPQKPHGGLIRPCEIEDAIQEITAEASEAVLGGFQLHSDVEIIRWPDRYMDDRDREF